MAFLSIVMGVALIALSLVSFFLSETRSGTAFIPAGFGVVLLVCGVIATRGGTARKHAMHAAAAFAMLGLLGVVGRIVPALLRGAELNLAIVSQMVMAALMLVFTIAAVRSFIAARRARRLESTGASS